jgi:hypothetical protein
MTMHWQRDGSVLEVDLNTRDATEQKNIREGLFLRISVFQLGRHVQLLHYSGVKPDKAFSNLEQVAKSAGPVGNGD